MSGTAMASSVSPTRLHMLCFDVATDMSSIGEYTTGHVADLALALMSGTIKARPHCRVVAMADSLPTSSVRRRGTSIATACILYAVLWLECATAVQSISDGDQCDRSIARTSELEILVMRFWHQSSVLGPCRCHDDQHRDVTNSCPSLRSDRV